MVTRFNGAEPEEHIDYSAMKVEEGDYTVGDESSHGWGLWLNNQLMGYYESEMRATYAGKFFLEQPWNQEQPNV